MDELKVIPRSPTKSQQVDVHVSVHGFGYDCVKHDYKVLQHIQFSMRHSFPSSNGYVSLGYIYIYIYIYFRTLLGDI